MVSAQKRESPARVTSRKGGSQLQFSAAGLIARDDDLQRRTTAAVLAPRVGAEIPPREGCGSCIHRFKAARPVSKDSGVADLGGHLPVDDPAVVQLRVTAWSECISHLQQRPPS